MECSFSYSYDFLPMGILAQIIIIGDEKVNKDKWIGYEELAWIEPIIAPPEQFREETESYCRLIRKHARIEPHTLLHLASGAGINDYTFKKYFNVTGVDISRGMLEVAKEINPEVTY